MLNLAIAAFMIGLVNWTNRRLEFVIDHNPLNFLDKILAAAAFFLALTIALTFGGAKENVTLILGKLAFFSFGFYSIEFAVYMVMFPSYDRSKTLRFFELLLLLLLADVVFRQFNAIDISERIGLKVRANSLFTGTLTNYFPYDWYDFFKIFFLFGLPLLSVIVMLLRAETKSSRLDHQKAIMNALAAILDWIILYILESAKQRVPMFITFAPLAFTVGQVIIIRTAVQNIIYDAFSSIGLIVTFTLCYAVPAIFVGYVFPDLWALHDTSRIQFYLLMTVMIALAVTVSYQISKIFKKKNTFRSSQYDEALEEALSHMDYSGEPEIILETMRLIFQENIGTMNIRVLIETSDELLESIYDADDQDHLKLETNSKIIDNLMNQNKQIVFKSFVDSGAYYTMDQKALKSLFHKTQSEAIIFLTEGRHIIAAILLGTKAGGNVFTDYDMEVFQKLYSYLFVFGYYMKNIGNRQVIGTINREIRMSEQIIASIQNNMDIIKSSKIDAGHIMVHAHNIGGEFVDLIRLTNERHIFVVGDLSGKGIAASMSMVICKSIIRSFLSETKDFKLLVDRVNRFIRNNLPKGTFFEGVFGLIDFTDNTIYYINCGIPSMFLYTKVYNNVMEIQGEGHILGFVKDITPYIKVKKVKLNPGDILVCCTDGLIDSRNQHGEKFGKERIQKAIAENTAQSSNKLAFNTFNSLSSYISKGLDDDVSILSLKCTGK